MSSLVKTQEREFDGVITGFCAPESVITGEVGRGGGPLCHPSANCCSPCLLFITKIQTLRMSFSVVLYGTVFTLVMIRVLLFLL